ncbi:uncharacterized protein LOC143146777 isoform X2 [Ptiloglossa arizonensis]|uniref:uncharacterized protein LOC143146777 isoform X2 n=1 Tax=Ptiloglossa arizonensis TaxID=3350558 RepID=UPI003FA04D8C
MNTDTVLSLRLSKTRYRAVITSEAGQVKFDRCYLFDSHDFCMQKCWANLNRSNN